MAELEAFFSLDVHHERLPLMLNRKPYRRVGGHIRRHGVAYAALAGVLALSPVPSVAADLVTTDEIANGAVTAPKLATGSVFSSTVADESLKTADIKDGNVTYEDLSTSARGAKVYRYNLGDLDFTGGAVVLAQLPGAWDTEKVANSTWTASFLYPTCGCYYSVPGYGFQSATDYRVLVTDAGVVQIDGKGPGESYTNIRLFRTVATNTPSASLATADHSGGSVER